MISEDPALCANTSLSYLSPVPQFYSSHIAGDFFAPQKPGNHTPHTKNLGVKRPFWGQLAEFQAMLWSNSRICISRPHSCKKEFRPSSQRVYSQIGVVPMPQICPYEVSHRMCAMGSLWPMFKNEKNKQNGSKCWITRESRNFRPQFIDAGAAQKSSNDRFHSMS